MKHSIGIWQVGGFLFTGIVGTGLHFLFELSGECAAVALISAVNESVWEHMKLICFPMLLFSLIQYLHIGRKIPGFWAVKLTGTLAALVLIPGIYYTYTGALGLEADWFNIAIFFLAAGMACFLEYRLLQRGFGASLPGWIPPVIFLLIGGMFAIFTFFPLRIPLFQDPVDGRYGFFSLSS